MQPNVTPPSAPFWRSRLWRKLAWAMVALGAAGPAVFGLSQMGVAVRDAHLQVGQLQQTRAREVAYATERALDVIRRQVDSVTALPWTLSDQFTPAARRNEYGRLLRLLPVLESLSFVTAEGVLQLSVSRRQTDFVAGRDGIRQAPQIGSGKIGYRDAYEPVLAHEIVHEEPKVRGRTVALVNLRALAAELQEPLNTGAGTAYVVDGEGRVVLHPDQALMMRRQALPAPLQTTPELAQPAASMQGQDVLRSTAVVAHSQWVVVVEQPRDVVLAPFRSTAIRTALISMAAVVAAALVAAGLAGRISSPIRGLHSAAQRLSAGRMDTRITLHTNDELEDLAHQFNHMAASLQANVTELEDRVKERTRELTEANRHKDEFLAGMSHELRTPLNGILGFADVLREDMAGPLNGEQREYVEDIHRSGLLLLSLINDLLDQARLASGKLPLDLGDFDITETLDMAAAVMRRDIENKQQTLHLDVQPGMPPWHADARRIKQVVLNLLGNAVKFTPTGGRLDLRAGMSGDGSAWLEVQDTGPGIALENQERIFEWGEQLPEDTSEDIVIDPSPDWVAPNPKRQGTGLGLGLALVRGIVRAHGGDVTVRSALGRGATFRVTLPPASAPAPSPADERTTAP